MREAAWDTKILADSSFLSVCVCVWGCVCGCVCTYVWKDDEACLYRSNLYGHLTPASLSHSISLLTRATLKHIPDWSGGGFPFMWLPLCVHCVVWIYFFSFMHFSIYSFIWIAVHFNKVIANPLFYVHIKENNLKIIQAWFVAMDCRYNQVPQTQTQCCDKLAFVIFHLFL